MVFPDDIPDKPSFLFDGVDSVTRKDLQGVEDKLSAAQALIGTRADGEPLSVGEMLYGNCQAASGVIEFSMNYIDGGTVTIDGETYTYTDMVSLVSQVKFYYLPDKSDTLFGDKKPMVMSSLNRGLPRNTSATPSRPEEAWTSFETAIVTSTYFQISSKLFYGRDNASNILEVRLPWFAILPRGGWTNRVSEIIDPNAE